MLLPLTSIVQYSYFFSNSFHTTELYEATKYWSRNPLEAGIPRSWDVVQSQRNIVQSPLAFLLPIHDITICLSTGVEAHVAHYIGVVIESIHHTNKPKSRCADIGVLLNHILCFLLSDTGHIYWSSWISRYRTWRIQLSSINTKLAVSLLWWKLLKYQNGQ
jgi:hypothetical protein